MSKARMVYGDCAIEVEGTDDFVSTCLNKFRYFAKKRYRKMVKLMAKKDSAK